MARRKPVIEQHAGGGGAKAPPLAEEPAIAPGVPRPDWPTPPFMDAERLKRFGTHKSGRRPRPEDDDDPEDQKP